MSNRRTAVIDELMSETPLFTSRDKKLTARHYSEVGMTFMKQTSKWNAYAMQSIFNLMFNIIITHTKCTNTHMHNII